MRNDISNMSDIMLINKYSTATYLKVVPKRPVSQHLKECVMVYILSNIIQVIMLATSSDAFLGVNSSYPFGHITIWVNSTQENGLKLHHKNNIKI
jgi:hypothetical protein